MSKMAGSYFSNEIIFSLLFVIWTIFSIMVLKKKVRSFDLKPYGAAPSSFFELSLLLAISASLFVLIPICVQLLLRLCAKLEILAGAQTLITHALAAPLSAGALFVISNTVFADLRPAVYGAQSLFSIKKALYGAAAAVVLYPLFLIFQAIISLVALSVSSLPWNGQDVKLLIEQGAHSGPLFALTAFAVLLCVPFVEEFLFRGVLDAWLSCFFHPVLSAITASALFAALHYSPSQGASNYPILSSLFMFGLVASYLRRGSGHIMAAVGFHSAFNSFGFLSVYFSLLSK